MNVKFKEYCKISQSGVDKSIFTWRIYRGLSKYISFFFVKIKITANKVTTFKMFLEIFGVILLAFGDINLSIIGVVVLILGGILDHADGEVARFTKSTSLKGEYLDLINHRIIHPAYFFLLSIGIYHTNSQLHLVILGFIAALSYSISESSHNVAKRILFDYFYLSELDFKKLNSNSRGNKKSNKVKILNTFNFYLFEFEHIKYLTLVLLFVQKTEYLLYFYTPLLFFRSVYSIYHYMKYIAKYDC